MLDAVRATLHRYLFARLCLMICLWLLVVFWLGGLADYLPVRVGANETPVWVRAGLLIAMALGAGWITLAWWLPRRWRALPDRSLAVLVERLNPQLNNELVTTVELSDRSEFDADAEHAVSNPAAHQQMLERVRASAARDVQCVVPSDLFNWQPIWALGTGLLFATVFTIVFAFASPTWMGFWCQRLFFLSDESWPRKAQLRADGIQLSVPQFTGQQSAGRITVAFEDGVAKVPSGASIALRISAEAEVKKVPEVCTLFYSLTDGTRGRANLRRVGSPQEGWQLFTLDGPPLDSVSQDIQFSVVGLDARLRGMRLDVVESAVVADMRLRLSYPKYLLDEFSSRPASEVLEYRSGLRIPEGTEVVLLGRASTELSRIDYLVMDPDSQVADSDEESAEVPVRSLAVQGTEFAIPLGSISSNSVIELLLIDEFGLPSEQVSRYVVPMLEDTVPEVNSLLDGIGIAITPDAILPIRGTVVDDNAIGQTNLEIAFNESEPALVPLQLTSNGELQSDVDLQELQTRRGFSIQPEMTLGMVVTARDFYDLNGLSHEGRGQPQQLSVVTADQLLVILDRQELELRQRLELIMIELEQLDEALQSVKQTLREAAPDGTAGGSERLGLVALQVGNAVDADEEALQQRRMVILKVQQSVLQSDKSEQELLGIVDRVDNLRKQLINNRVDSYDRQERLQSKVFEPLTDLLRNEYRSLSKSLGELQSASMSGRGSDEAERALVALRKVLEMLESVKANMLDIESYNEIIDLVRSLLDDQDRLLEQSEKQQKSRIFDLLK